MDTTVKRLLEGQTALVTGASSGIGAATAIALAEAGAKVGGNYRGGRDAAEEIVARVRDHGSDALAIEADVADERSVEGMFSHLVDGFGRVDILVANAGLQRDAPATGMTLEQWRTVIDVNLTGQFLCAREAIKFFLKQGLAPASKALGKIVCMSSVHEVIPWAGHVNYAASKGGVLLMMKTLAQEVSEKKIRINAVAPGIIKTNINKETWSDAEKVQQVLKLVPYGPLGEPDDVAKTVVWLASDESDYVTGTTLFVDGGMTLYPAFRQAG